MAEQELNKLSIKSDSLPDSWLVTLVNPVTGAVAENMTVGKFVELLTAKLPLATSQSKGLLDSFQFNNMMSMKNSDIPLDANDILNTSYFINTLANLPNWGDHKNFPHGYGIFITYGNGYFIVQISYSSSGEAKRRIRVRPDINSWTEWINC